MDATGGVEAETRTSLGAGASGTDDRAVAAASSSSCPDCKENLLGDYCHACGEKRVDARDLSVKHFAKDAVQELTNLDSKLLRTVTGLLLKPGFLTLEWLAGRRNRYLKPLNLCLGIFAITIFAYSAYKPVSTYDFGRLVEADKTGNVVKLIDKWAARKNIPRDMFVDMVSEKWQKHISWLQILVVIFIALLLKLIFIFSGRYFVEHLVFSLHLVSFSFLVVVLLWPVYLVVGVDPTPRSQLLASGVWLIYIAYLFMALRAVYKLKVFKTLLLSIIVFVGYFVSYVLVYLTAIIVALVHAVKF
ncbi:MAG TPA: DUF3667 domain-containing protein [Pyrinomonadaceae bacterium]|jgi:hypothetical protein|nr:DUF3667 domain-containing protein [Pyrinomonadaceae bacterium]